MSHILYLTNQATRILIRNYHQISHPYNLGSLPQLRNTPPAGPRSPDELLPNIKAGERGGAAPLCWPDCYDIIAMVKPIIAAGSNRNRTAWSDDNHRPILQPTNRTTTRCFCQWRSQRLIVQFKVPLLCFGFTLNWLIVYSVYWLVVLRPQQKWILGRQLLVFTIP